MTRQWFRMYADVYRHPKLALLNDFQFRFWVSLCCLACENDGLIPPLDALNKLLMKRKDHCRKAIRALMEASLISETDGGYQLYNWGKRQYKSDSSTERVKRFRDRKYAPRNVSATPPDIESETDNSSIALGGGDEGKAFVSKADTSSQPNWTAEQLDEIACKCRAAAGVENDPRPSLINLAPIMGLLDAGYSLALVSGKIVMVLHPTATFALIRCLAASV